MSDLLAYLHSRVSTLKRSVRQAIAARHEREWFDADEHTANRWNGDPEMDDPPEWVSSPRLRMHFGIRKRIAKLRVARARLLELQTLKGLR
jgi:hypothetical protein